MSFDLQELEDRCLLRLDESVTVNRAGELHQVLGRALNLKKRVEIDLERAVEFDVSALQLLFAAANAAKQAGTGLSLSGTVPDCLERSFVDSGLDPFGSVSEPVAG
jgi:anti-anti-sigma regulatory factor